MKFAYPVFALFLLCYLGLFAFQEQSSGQMEPSVTAPLPAIIQRVAMGSFKELAAEVLFVKVAVFNGHHLSRSVMDANIENLSLNLDVATDLYPKFVDPYYLCQATLPHYSPEYAAKANDILERYEEADLQEIIIPFYRGFNLFYYMDEPQQAAEVFKKLSLRDDAPNWFGHFASILTARGGDLYAGLVSLQSMLAVETDEKRRARYLRDIAVFEKAIMVQKATDVYSQTFGVYPETLSQLVPVFIPFVPEIEGGFLLEWTPPKLRLIRPLR